MLRELNNLFRTLSSKFHLTLHSHTNAEHWAYVEKLIENGTMGYQAKELTRISAPTFDLRGAYCFLVSLASLHSTIPLIVLYRSVVTVVNDQRLHDSTAPRKGPPGFEYGTPPSSLVS